MQDEPQLVSQQLLREEIARIVAEAKPDGAALRTGYHAAQLAAAYPNCGFSLGRIINELIAEAASQHVPLEIARG